MFRSWVGLGGWRPPTRAGLSRSITRMNNESLTQRHHGAPTVTHGSLALNLLACCLTPSQEKNMIHFKHSNIFYCNCSGLSQRFKPQGSAIPVVRLSGARHVWASRATMMKRRLPLTIISPQSSGKANRDLDTLGSGRTNVISLSPCPSRGGDTEAGPLQISGPIAISWFIYIYFYLFVLQASHHTDLLWGFPFPVLQPPQLHMTSQGLDEFAHCFWFIPRVRNLISPDFCSPGPGVPQQSWGFFWWCLDKPSILKVIKKNLNTLWWSLNTKALTLQPIFGTYGNIAAAYGSTASNFGEETRVGRISPSPCAQSLDTAHHNG